MISPDALACLIYTSGTGGAPKGVMLPHRRDPVELPWRERPAGGAAAACDHEVYLSFLPLSHSYEHTAGQFFLLSIGAEVVYARGVEHSGGRHAGGAADHHDHGAARAGGHPGAHPRPGGAPAGLAARLFDRAIAVGLRACRGRRAVAAGGGWRIALLERLVRRKVRARFGGRLRAAMSGGARLEPEVGRFFIGLGVTLLQGYGQTEAGPVVSANRAGRRPASTPSAARSTGWNCASPLDGEILVRGDLVMLGYWGRPEKPRWRSAMAGCIPATSASSTPTAICASPTARRT